MISSLLINLPTFTPIKNSNVTVEAIFNKTTFTLAPNTNFGDCACDVSSQCDPFCCCDTDCVPGTVFPYCISEEENPGSLRMCDEEEMEGKGTLIDWFLRTSLCISRNNNPSPGDYYDLDYNSENIEAVGNEASLENVYTNEGALPSQLLRPFTEISDTFKVARLGPGGFCVQKPILYLEPVDEQCFNLTDQFKSRIINASSCANNSCFEIAYNESNKTGSEPEIVAETRNIISTKIFWGTNQPTQSSAPQGYRTGQIIDGINGTTITVANNCSEINNGNGLPLRFGENFEVECNLDSVDVDSDNLTYFENNTFTLNHSYYYISPFSNNLANNNGTIRQEFPPPLNLTSVDLVLRVGYVVQTFNIIYKSIGLKRYPQHIITDFFINYDATKTAVKDNYNFPIGFENNTHITPIIGPSTPNAVADGDITELRTKLRVYVRFIEEPNDANLRISPPTKLTAAQAWLPF